MRTIIVILAIAAASALPSYQRIQADLQRVSQAIEASDLAESVKINQLRNLKDMSRDLHHLTEAKKEDLHERLASLKLATTQPELEEEDDEATSAQNELEEDEDNAPIARVSTDLARLEEKVVQGSFDNKHAILADIKGMKHDVAQIRAGDSAPAFKKALSLRAKALKMLLSAPTLEQEENNEVSFEEEPVLEEDEEEEKSEAAPELEEEEEEEKADSEGEIELEEGGDENDDDEAEAEPALEEEASDAEPALEEEASEAEPALEEEDDDDDEGAKVAQVALDVALLEKQLKHSTLSNKKDIFRNLESIKTDAAGFATSSPSHKQALQEAIGLRMAALRQQMGVKQELEEVEDDTPKHRALEAIKDKLSMLQSKLGRHSAARSVARDMEAEIESYEQGGKYAPSRAELVANLKSGLKEIASQ